ncbi:hypothetical protein [Amycolatopsis speibonae]|uniref:Uncharacterized protein n=1 Tax=Amycolatopsis speibonae TaxID=1450224 RepID=A0ABV7P8H8_9PSEU
MSTIPSLSEDEARDLWAGDRPGRDEYFFATGTVWAWGFETGLLEIDDQAARAPAGRVPRGPGPARGPTARPDPGRPPRTRGAPAGTPGERGMPPPVHLPRHPGLDRSPRTAWGPLSRSAVKVLGSCDCETLDHFRRNPDQAARPARTIAP